MKKCSCYLNNYDGIFYLKHIINITVNKLDLLLSINTDLIIRYVYNRL